MLRDLIYALGGNPGNIFKELSVGRIEVIPGLPGISRSEEEALNHVLHLATRFLSFQKFISAHTCTLNAFENEDLADGLKPGCYIKAFCLGLDNILSEYRQCLLSIEKEILKDKHLSLLYVQHETNSYHMLFDAINDVITTIKNRKSHGCQLLDIVYRATLSGNSCVKKCMLAILQQCHIVMYKQLTSWLLHGLLIDQHHEFFIQYVSNELVSGQTSGVAGGGSANETDISLTVKSENLFKVRLEYLPFYIPGRIAEMICFIGSSLHLFESDQPDSSQTYLNNAASLVEMKSVDAVLKLEGILQAQEKEFLSDLYSLQQNKEFIIEDFEMCVDKIRSAVAKELWLLCVEKAQLVSHFYLLKDFFLLGRGELFLVFIEEADHLLRNPPSRVTEHDVQQAFLRSAAKVQIEEEVPLDMFQLTINSKPTDSQAGYCVDFSTVDDGWARLGLSFSVKWPLHTIFTPGTLEKYSQLFKFLLRVRRTQSALQKVWSIQMKNKQDADKDIEFSTGNVHSISECKQWQCRSQMQIFIDNLQYYLQADVLESHFTNLLHKIRSANDAQRDFESIIMAHDNFLNALLAQCFLLSSAVCSSLLEILDICQKFCDIVLTSSLLIGNTEMEEQVAQLWDMYSKKTYMFFQVLSGVCTHQCNPHISQLTLRLDYNRYFSSVMRKPTSLKNST